MTPEIILVFSILIVTIILFAFEVFSVDKIAMLIIASLALTGLVNPEDAISGFSNTATITVLSLMIIALALEDNGVIASLARFLKNLHILDYDYYFDIVDALLSQNHSQPLLLFDEILRKGFDGHNFIVGLGEHLRNLLVSQDARTTNLMEVPESVKKKYAQQAQSAPPSILLTWLNIASQCDINYKTLKNQRLGVELALMKMANVTAILQPEEFDIQSQGLKKKVIA